MTPTEDLPPGRARSPPRRDTGRNDGICLGSTSGGMAPTGKKAEWRAFPDYRFDGGVIVEAAQIHDRYEQYLQLGLIEPPGG